MPAGRSDRTLTETIELVDIGTYELAASRDRRDDEGGRIIVGPGGPRASDEPLPFEFSLISIGPPEETRLLVRLLAEYTGDNGNLRVGVQAEFDLRQVPPEDLSEGALDQFITHDAIGAIAPYMRHYVALLSRETLGISTTLGILRPEDLGFSDPVSTELYPRELADE